MYLVKIYLVGGSVVSAAVKDIELIKKAGGISSAEWTHLPDPLPRLAHVNVDKIEAVTFRRAFIVTPWFVI